MNSMTCASVGSEKDTEQASHDPYSDQSVPRLDRSRAQHSSTSHHLSTGSGAGKWNTCSSRTTNLLLRPTTDTNPTRRIAQHPTITVLESTPCHGPAMSGYASVLSCKNVAHTRPNQLARAFYSTFSAQSILASAHHIAHIV